MTNMTEVQRAEIAVEEARAAYRAALGPLERAVKILHSARLAAQVGPLTWNDVDERALMRADPDPGVTMAMAELDATRAQVAVLREQLDAATKNLIEHPQCAVRNRLPEAHELEKLRAERDAAVRELDEVRAELRDGPAMDE